MQYENKVSFSEGLLAYLLITSHFTTPSAILASSPSMLRCMVQRQRKNIQLPPKVSFGVPCQSQNNTPFLSHLSKGWNYTWNSVASRLLFGTMQFARDLEKVLPMLWFSSPYSYTLHHAPEPILLSLWYWSSHHLWKSVWSEPKAEAQSESADNTLTQFWIWQIRRAGNFITECCPVAVNV